ncbi:MAG: hypothetical protein AAF355_04835 [Myxococcota bacterium]
MSVSTSDVIGHWIGIFVTLAIFSYLYADNVFYKFVEHVFVGISIGYVLVIQYYEVLKPNLIDRLLDPTLGTARAVYLTPLILVVFLFLRLSRKFGWLGRIAIAFVIGTYAGIEVPAVANSDLVEQLASTVGAVHQYSLRISSSGQSVTSAVMATWTDALGCFVLVFGMAAALVYFFFSIEHRGVVGGVAKAGVWVLMVGFGAAFGYTVQGRISLAIGRAMYCLGTNQSPEQAIHYKSKMVSLILVVVMLGVILLLEQRKKREESQPTIGADNS